MKFNINDIDTICISGGGNKTFTFIGALNYFINEHNLKIDNIKKYCGTSGGSIICYFLNLGYTIDETEQFLVKLNFYKIINNYFNLDKIITNYGLDDGEKVIFVLRELLMSKYNIEDITFQELYDITKKEFIIIGTNYTRGIERVFSYKLTPNMSVITAIRISISIPVIFTPILFEGEYYIDGGITNNFPINYCNPNTTLGLLLKNCVKNDINNVLDIYFNSLNILCDANTIINIKNNNNIILIINTPEMIEKGIADFNLDEDYKKFLIDVGYKCSKCAYEN